MIDYSILKICIDDLSDNRLNWLNDCLYTYNIDWRIISSLYQPENVPENMKFTINIRAMSNENIMVNLNSRLSRHSSVLKGFLFSITKKYICRRLQIFFRYLNLILSTIKHWFCWSKFYNWKHYVGNQWFYYTYKLEQRFYDDLYYSNWFYHSVI